jgi:hypothetical protein
MRTSRTQRHCPGSPAQTAASTSPPPPARSKKAEGKRQARRRRQRRRWRAGGKRYLGPAPVLVGEGEGGERADAPDAGDGPLGLASSWHDFSSTNGSNQLHRLVRETTLSSYVFFLVFFFTDSRLKASTCQFANCTWHYTSLSYYLKLYCTRSALIR